MGLVCDSWVGFCWYRLIGPKQRGDFSFEISPLAIRFFEDLVRHTDHNYSSLQNCSEPSGGARASRTLPSFHSLQELSCSIRGSQLPECCVSLASGSLASPLSASLAGIVSDALPSSVAGSLPNLVPDSHPEFLIRPLRVTLPVPLEILSRGSCELRFRLSDGSCLLSPSGGLLLR